MIAVIPGAVLLARRRWPEWPSSPFGEETGDACAEVAQGGDVGNLRLGQFEREFLFDGEKEFYGGHLIEGVHAEVCDQAVVGVDVCEVDFEMRNEKFAQATGGGDLVGGKVGRSKGGWIEGRILRLVVGYTLLFTGLAAKRGAPREDGDDNEG